MVTCLFKGNEEFLETIGDLGAIRAAILGVDWEGTLQGRWFLSCLKGQPIKLIRDGLETRFWFNLGLDKPQTHSRKLSE